MTSLAETAMAAEDGAGMIGQHCTRALCGPSDHGEHDDLHCRRYAGMSGVTSVVTKALCLSEFPRHICDRCDIG